MKVHHKQGGSRIFERDNLDRANMAGMLSRQAGKQRLASKAANRHFNESHQEEDTSLIEIDLSSSSNSSIRHQEDHHEHHEPSHLNTFDRERDEQILFGLGRQAAASNSSESSDREEDDDSQAAGDLESPREELSYRHLGGRSPVRDAWGTIKHHMQSKRAASPLANGGRTTTSDGHSHRWSKALNRYTIEIGTQGGRLRHEECRENISDSKAT